MSALNDLQQAADAIIAFVPGYSTGQQDLATQYGDIDPAAEDAQAKFDALESGPRVALQAVNVEYNALISKMKSLSAAAIAEDATAANALIDNIENLIAPLRGIITNTAKSIQAAITKAKVEKNRLTSPLFNGQLFAHHIELAFTEIHRRYVCGEKLEHIDVESLLNQPNSYKL
jgi:hypothetical protein